VAIVAEGSDAHCRRRARASTHTDRRSSDDMSPLKEVQPTAAPDASPAPVKPAHDAPPAPAFATGAENASATTHDAAVPRHERWTDIQRRAHHGSNIFAADPSPAKNQPLRAVPAPVDAPVPVVPASPSSTAPVVALDPKDLSLRDLRAACRERGLNPGGGKPALEERLVIAIAAGACAPLSAPAPLAGSKRASPGAASDADAGRKAARLANERSVVFAAPSPVPKAPLAEAYKTHKADVFLADFMNSPRKDAGGVSSKRRATVSDAKLRDLGVGRDVFAVGAESVDARRPDTEAAAAKAREAAGSNIFEHGEAPVPVRVAADTGAAAAKAREAAGSNIFADDADPVPARVPALGAAHAATHSIFAEETAEEAAAATRANLGGKTVSETMKRSLFEGNRLFDDDAEAAAAEAARAKATARDDASRTTSRAHHVGHGVLGMDWVTPREEGEEGDDELMASTEAPPAMRTPEVDKNFKPFGAQTPAVDLRWKTEEEDEREMAVGMLVAEAIARVIGKHGSEETEMDEEDA
jgi:hypothetical protein